MNNFSVKLKKIFGNKNIVTALCFVLIGIVLIVGYQWRVNSAVVPIKVPYALVDIPPQTVITEDMVGSISIAKDAIKKDVMYTNKKSIVGMYSNLESTIYKGSFFYKGAVVSKDNLPTSALLDVPDGYSLLSLDITMKSSYYNSLVPNDYFDLYVRTLGKIEDKNGKSKEKEIIVGKLIDKIKILAVKTSGGENVFGSGEKKTPAGLLFALPEDQYLLVKKAEYFSKLSGVDTIQFVPVPRGKKYKTEDGTEVTSTVTSEELQQYINEKTKDIDQSLILPADE